jgi:hypothetical protein
MEVARLPVSVSQGQMIAAISDARDRLVTPVSQARILSTLRNRARELDAMTKTWNTIGDEKVRPSHAAKDGETIPMHRLFVLDGGMMLQPRDGSLGASLSEIINCFPPWQKLHASPIGAVRRKYDGKLITIETVSGKQLTVTTNHPVLGENGWIAAHLVREGAYIACGGLGRGVSECSNVQGGDPTAEQIFNSLSTPFRVVRDGGLTIDFHGEIPDGDIEIVHADGKLRDRIEIRDPFAELGFIASDLGEGALLRQSSVQMSGSAERTISDSLVGRSSESFPLGGTHALHTDSVLLAGSTARDSSLIESVTNRSTGDTNSLRYRKDRGLVLAEVKLNDTQSTRICFEPVARVFVQSYKGFVYNIHDEKGYLVGNGIVNHNCRCFLTYD